MTQIPEVSIIIVSYNVRDLLLKCVESIYKYCKGETAFEIIIVDNSSTDGSVETISHNFPEIIVIANSRNTGFTFANNQGISRAKGKNIFLLNPDTEINSDVLTFMYSETSDLTSQIIAPKLLNSDGSLQISCYKFPGLFAIIAETFYLHNVFRIYSYKLINFDGKFSPDWASGAALFFRKEVYDIVGPLDEHLFWMDDVDYCLRASIKGIKIYYHPGIEIVHHSGKSSAKNLSVTISNQLISKAKYFLKHQGSISSVISMLFIFIHILSRIIVFFLISIFKRQYKSKLKAYLYTLNKYFYFIVSMKSASSTIS